MLGTFLHTNLLEYLINLSKVKNKRPLLALTVLFLFNISNAQNCIVGLSTGLKYHCTDKNTFALQINFGASVIAEGFAFNDVTIRADYNPCITIDPSRVWYKGKEYNNIDHPQLFEGFSPGITYVSWGFDATCRINNKTVRISEPIVYSGRFSNLVTFWSMEEMSAWKKNNPNFSVKQSDFYYSNLRIGDIAYKNCSGIIDKINAYEANNANIKKLNELYTTASNQFNSNDLENSLKTAKEGLNLTKSKNINDPRFQTLIDKIEAKNSDAKKAAAKKQLDELYTTAKGQVTKNDKSGALATISKAEAIIEKEKLTDDRFSTLKSQVEKSSDSSSKTSSDSTSSEKTESSAEESTSQNQTSQEETGPTPEEISQQQERDRLNRQQEYINNRQDAISDNIDMASMGAAQILLAYYALGRVIYDKIDNKAGNMISAPGSAFELQLGYSISSFPIYINITEEEYDGNTYTYDQYSEKRTPFSLNMNAAINGWLLKSADKGFGVSIKGWAGQGLYFQNFHLGGEFGMKGYWGHDWLQFYAEYINGHRRLSYNDWIDPGKTQEGKTRINYHQIKAGPRFSTESDWNGITRLNVDVLPIFEVYRGVQHLQYGSNPLGFYWRKGIELGLKFDNRLNFTLQINGQYPVKGDDLFGFKEYQKWSGTGFTFSVLRSLEFYNNHLKLPDRATMYSWLSDLSIDEVRFTSPSVEWLTPSNRLYNGKPSMLSLKLFEYIVNTEIYDNIQLGIGGNLGVRTLNFQAKPGYYTPTVAEGYEHSQSAVAVSAPIELKYYTDFNYNKRNWLLAGLEYRKNLVKWQNNRKLELDQPKSSSNTISSIRTDGLFWKIGIGMDYAVGESFVTTGIQYKRSMHLALPGDITRVQGIELVFGLKI